MLTFSKYPLLQNDRSVWPAYPSSAPGNQTFPALPPLPEPIVQQTGDLVLRRRRYRRYRRQLGGSVRHRSMAPRFPCPIQAHRHKRLSVGVRSNLWPTHQRTNGGDRCHWRWYRQRLASGRRSIRPSAREGRVDAWRIVIGQSEDAGQCVSCNLASPSTLRIGGWVLCLIVISVKHTYLRADTNNYNYHSQIWYWFNFWDCIITII